MLTADGNRYSGDVERGEFVPEEPRRGADSSDLLGNPSDGHGDHTGALQDANDR